MTRPHFRLVLLRKGSLAPPRVRLMCLHKLKMLSEVLLSSANRDLV